MKALLSQWIGGATVNKGQLPTGSASSEGSGEQETGSESQPFLAFMANVLGTGKAATDTTDTAAMAGEPGGQADNPSQDGETGQDNAIVKGQDAGAMAQSFGRFMKSGDGKAAITPAKVKSAGTQSGRRSADTAEKVQNGNSGTDGTANVLRNEGSADSASIAMSGATTAEASTTPGKNVGSEGANNKGMAKTANAGADMQGAAAKMNERALKKNTGQLPFNGLVSENAGKTKQAILTDGKEIREQFAKALKKGTESKGSAPSPDKQAGMNITAGNTSAEELESLRKQMKQSQDSKGRGQKGTDPKLQSLAGSRSPRQHQSVSPRPDTNTGSFMPGKFTSGHQTNGVDIEMDMESSQDFKGGSESAMKQMQYDELSSSQLREAGGRKSFGKQLAQASRQQFIPSSQTSKDASSQWKHHRFVLEDGKSLHVAARNTEGALQLQLNAGKGELGKMLHQHLNEIQQHVQEELNIEIDLQLQDFGAEQQAQQQTGTSSEKADSPGAGEVSADTESTDGSNPATAQKVRYYGFNSNEWTA